MAASSVDVIEVTGALDGASQITAGGAVIVEAGASLSLAGDITVAAVALGAARSTSSARGTFEPAPLSIATSGGANLTAAVRSEVAGSTTEPPPLQSPQEPELLPLVCSHEADDLEAELKALFIQLFEAALRADERHVNVLGMPHLGPRELVEQSLAADGLSIYRGASVAAGAGAYLLRSWRSMNPKRGLHLLQTYLQLLWPNVWTASQMWQRKAGIYPNALAAENGGNHYLTSRVNVSLPSSATTGGDLNAISAGLRAALPARMLMNLAITSEEEFEFGVASAFYGGLVAQHYEGSFT